MVLKPKPEFIPVEDFYLCLDTWFGTDRGKKEWDNVVFNKEGDISSKIKGWRQYVSPVSIDFNDAAADGPIYLDDIKAIHD